MRATLSNMRPSYDAGVQDFKDARRASVDEQLAAIAKQEQRDFDDAKFFTIYADKHKKLDRAKADHEKFCADVRRIAPKMTPEKLAQIAVSGFQYNLESGMTSLNNSKAAQKNTKALIEAHYKFRVLPVLQDLEGFQNRFPTRLARLPKPRKVPPQQAASMSLDERFFCNGDAARLTASATFYVNLDDFADE